MHAFIFACFEVRGPGVSKIDGVPGICSGSAINASGFTHIASERFCDARKERVASGRVL